VEFGKDFLEKLIVGDDAAWDQAYPWLLPIAKAKVSTPYIRKRLPSEIEDLASIARDKLRETLKKGFKGNPEKLENLLSVIAVGVAKDRWRKHLAHIHGSGRIDPLDDENGNPKPVPDPNGFDPFENLMKDERKELIKEAKQTLKPQEWQLIEDYFFGCLSQKEIHENRGIPMGSVGVKIGRALNKLEPILKKYR